MITNIQQVYLSIIAYIIGFVQYSKAGQIIGSEPIMDYSNSNYMSQLHLKLSVENSLQNTDYLKLEFPFGMHKKLTAAVNTEGGLSHPKQLFLTWNELVEVNGENHYQEDQPGRLFTETVDSSNYYIQLYNQNYTQYSLESEKFYILKFNISDVTALGLQKGGELLQIQASTQSSVHENAIIYDKNPCFGYLFLESQPTELMSLSTTFGDPTIQRDLDVEQELFLDLTINYPTSEFQDEMRIEFLLSDNSYLFQNTCNSIDKTTIPTIDALLEDDFVCNIDTINNKVVFIIQKSAIERQNVIRFQVFVQSPKRTVQNVDVISRLLYKFNPKILTETTVMSVLSTNPIDVSEQDISLSFGMTPHYTLPFELKFVRGNEDGDYKPYNGVRIDFQLAKNTPENQELRVNFYIKAEITAHVLMNSITENLPNAERKLVTCQEHDILYPSIRKISCSGVGTLLASETYHIAFKIFLPYDVYEPDVQMINFGVITIETSEQIQKWDNLFIVGRDQAQLQEFLKMDDSVIVKTDIQAYLDYLKSFDDVYLMGIASNFPDYVQQMYPSFYQTGQNLNIYGDIFLPQENLAFLNYLKTFNDVWVIQKNIRSPIRDLDIIKYQSPSLLVEKSICKNELSLGSVIANDFTSSAQKTIISSIADAQSITPGYDLGLKKDAAAQLITFQTDILLEDVTGFDITAGTDYTPLNNVGLLMMMNSHIVPQVVPSNEDSLITAVNPTEVEVVSETATSNGNQYTYFKVSFQSSDALREIASETSTDLEWGIRSFVLNQFSSLYVDDRMMDFYITTIDGIDGPLNLQSTTSYTLINAFSLNSGEFNSLTTAISNFWSPDNADNDLLSGEFIPTYFKLIEAGVVGDRIDASNIKLAVFFDEGEGFFQNKHNYKSHCSSTETDNESTCKIYPKGDVFDLHQYGTLNRFEIDISDPTTLYQIIFPVEMQAIVSEVNMYIASFIENPNYPGKKYELLNGVQQITPASFTPDSTLIDTSFLVGGHSGEAFGITPCTGATCTVGSATTDQVLQMALGTTSAVAGNESQYTFVADYDFLGDDATITGWPLSDANYPTACLPQNYRYISDTYVQMKYGIACTWFSQSNSATNSVTISNFNLPSFSGLEIQGYGSLSNESGELVALVGLDSTFIIENSAAITEFTQSIEITPSMKKQVLEWELTTPVDILRDFYIKIESAEDPVTAFPFSQEENLAQCVILVKSSDGEDGEQDFIVWDVECSPSFPNSSSIVFTGSSLFSSIPSGSKILIQHYGIDSTMFGSDNSFSVQILDSLDGADESIIATTADGTNGTISYLSSSDTSELVLSELVSSSRSKNAMTNISFKFSFVNKKLWGGEQVVFDLGQFAFENQFDVNNLECKVYEEDKMTISHYFENVILGTLSNLTVKIRKYYNESNSSFYLVCERLSVPTAASGQGIFAQIQSGDLTTQLSSAILPLPEFFTENPNIYENSLSKKLGTPGSNLELEFDIKTSKLDIDSKSRVVIVFPIYYSPKLSRDNTLACYYNTVKISCTVTTDRTLEIKYFPEDIPAKQDIIVEVVGVTQPLNYQVGDFFVAFDDDYDDTTYIEYGTIRDQGLETQGDSQASLEGTLEVRNFYQESNYLRETDVEYTFTINFPSKYSNIKYGYVVMVNFPKIFETALSNLKPECGIYREGDDKNYVGICQIKGLKAVMYIKEEIVSGYNYLVQITNVRNPDGYKPSAFKWIIEVGDDELGKVLWRTLETSTNYVLPPFIVNPNQDYLFYKDANGQVIESLEIIKGVQSQDIYIGRVSESNVFARSFVLRSITDDIKVNPLSVEVNVGTSERKFTINSQNGIGEYYFIVSKDGDGDYYSNLPVLFLKFDDRSTETFQIRQTSLNIYKSTDVSNYLIFYDISSLSPLEGLQVEFYQENQDDIGLEIWEQFNVATLDYIAPYNQIPLRVNNPTLFIEGVENTISYRISGTNRESYELTEDPTIDFTVVASPTGDNIATINPGVTSQTSQTFQVECSHMGIFYYQYYLTQYSTQCIQSDTIFFEGGWRNYTQNDLHIQCESKYGILGVYDEATQYEVKLDSLKAGTSYSFVGQCVSQLGVESERIITDFITTDNGGQLGRIQIDLAEQPTLEQRTKLACFLSLYFTSHPQLVITDDGTYCSQINYPIHEYRRRVLQEQVEGLDCEDPNSVDDLDGMEYYSVYFYFAPNHFVAEDDLKNRLQDATGLVCFKDLVQSYSNGIPEILNVHNAVLINDTPPTLTEDPVVYNGWEWANVDNFKFSGTGRIFVTLQEQADTLPSKQQVMNGLNADNEEAFIFKEQLIQQNDQEFNITFTGLDKDKDYIVNYVIGQESPFSNVKVGDLQQIEFTTKKIPDVYAQVQIFMYSLFLVILVLII